MYIILFHLEKITKKKKTRKNVIRFQKKVFKGPNFRYGWPTNDLYRRDVIRVRGSFFYIEFIYIYL